VDVAAAITVRDYPAPVDSGLGQRSGMTPDGEHRWVTAIVVTVVLAVLLFAGTGMGLEARAVKR